MRYKLAPIFCRPWLLNGLSTRLLESHYENNYGGALRRLNAITEKLQSLDFAKTPGYVINGLKREELIALNSTLLHELYFASLGVAPVAKGRNIPRPAGALAEALARDFGSFERWRDEFVAMGNALAGGSGWVLLVYVPRDRRLINQYASEHTLGIAGGIPVLALDMYEHAYHIDFGANARAYIDAFIKNIDWKAAQGRHEDAAKVEPPRPLVQEEFGDLPGVGRRGSEGDARGWQASADHRRPPAALHVAAAGHHGRCDLARPGPRAGMVRRAVEVRPGGGVLRIRLPCRLQDRDHAAGGRLRREVHEGWPLGLEGDWRRNQTHRGGIARD